MLSQRNIAKDVKLLIRSNFQAVIIKIYKMFCLILINTVILVKIHEYTMILIKMQKNLILGCIMSSLFLLKNFLFTCIFTWTLVYHSINIWSKFSSFFLRQNDLILTFQTIMGGGWACKVTHKIWAQCSMCVGSNKTN